ncbi:10615_t:CDS:2, partial [Dentiscutata erythropus]
GDDFDKRQWSLATTYKQYNMRESYRNKFELGRLTKNSNISQSATRSTLRKKPKNQTLNNEINEDFSIPTSAPTTQEQTNYIEWENKKLELQWENLAILKEEIALWEKLNGLKQLSN